MLRTQDDVNELSLSLASDDSTVLAGTTGDTHTDTQTLATVNNSFCHVYSGACWLIVVSEYYKWSYQVTVHNQGFHQSDSIHP